jgi:hypothetical protein
LLSWPSKVIDGSQIGLSRKEIHEARIIRDAEVAEPGMGPQARCASRL